MPFVKRKVVELVPPPTAVGPDDPDVFYLAATGEIFPDYESYANRLTFYNQKLFQCELTGKINLTYFEALKSERKEAIALHKIFPEQLKQPVLRSVQFQVTGRIDHLVDKVYDRFKDRFFPGEQVFVETEGEKYYAIIKSVDAPKRLANGDANGKSPKIEDDQDDDAEAEAGSSTANGSSSSSTDLHRVGTNLDLEFEDATAQDDPSKYVYHVEFLDDEDQTTGPTHTTAPDKISRDRLAFSKTILRKYMRDCLVRAANIGAEWRVKEWLARKYGLPLEPTDEIALKNEAIKDAKLSKRKKYLLTDAEDSSASTTSKKPKTEAGTPGKKMSAAAKRKADEAEKAAMEQAKEEERIRKKNLKYPIEDLDLDPISSRELNFQSSGELPRRKERPVPLRGDNALPVPADLFEIFITTYYFLVSLGKPLHLSAFTLDDFEQALKHNTLEPSCGLMTEVHSVLLNVIVRDGAKIAVPGAGGLDADEADANDDDEDHDNDDNDDGSDDDEASSSHSGSGSGSDDEQNAKPNGNGKSRSSKAKSKTTNGAEVNADSAVVGEILQAAHELGQGWGKRVLKFEDKREGWEHSLVGLIAGRATPEVMPRMIGILSQLTGIEHKEGYTDEGEWIADTYLSPVDRYPLLSVRDKLHILDFLCMLAVMTKPVKSFYDECDTQLTELRKERIEVSRDRRKLAEDWDEFEGKKKGDKDDGDAGNGNGNGDADVEDAPLPTRDEDGSTSDEDEDEDEEEDELVSDDDTRSGREDSSFSDRSGARGGGVGSRQDILRQKALEKKAHEAAKARELALAREAHRLKVASNKKLTAAKKKLEDQEARLTRREEVLEREFRRLGLAARMVPLGRDRFGDKYWWFDGVGSCSVVAGHGVAERSAYQTGRLFIQAASVEESEALIPDPPSQDTPKSKFAHLFHPPITAELVSSRKTSELGGDPGILHPGEWAVYTEPDQVEELIAWLRTKGQRENNLKSSLLKFRSHLTAGMRKRNQDITASLRDQFDAVRRSSRSKSDSTHSSTRLSYLAWKNTLDKGR
ncbi:hypothetical protein BCV70DRAFT_46508 [Testicularia cyperi]|uniref:WAC domain-containing protein n=1 Tax=Testicularia cyperi TaxID=1882483 RepID=A0A317XKK8_9BASI|nr:hypothetical protein BCV70DRAFT_46508 [Testicularia cyperi]